ncbi:tetratricopeptide repeat protein [Lutibaculum baratangense]|uniref:TPR repeat protein n=1 Tax=Lutibaculum baratangense AMV1 TaxID=631454 RepID=V4RCH9_9HYPH|nr:tetratricopeptide repeat protein [Lutibaculum baratangense]ESR23099.1 TPR repeat protein [Lutibaculum baratangense AMV1]
MLRRVVDRLKRASRLAAAAIVAVSAIGGVVFAAPADSRVSRDDLPEVELLLDRLSESASPEGAGRIERRILANWSRSGSDTVDLLMNRAAEAMAAKEHDRALLYLDRVVTIAPGYAEGWNRRATLHYLRNDYARSLNDIGRVLALQPRHFGALNGLGLVLDELDQDGPALEAFRRALDVHPYLDGAEERVNRLSKSVDGLPI